MKSIICWKKKAYCINAYSGIVSVDLVNQRIRPENSTRDLPCVLWQFLWQTGRTRNSGTSCVHAVRKPCLMSPAGSWHRQLQAPAGPAGLAGQTHTACSHLARATVFRSADYTRRFPDLIVIHALQIKKSVRNLCASGNASRLHSFICLSFLALFF